MSTENDDDKEEKSKLCGLSITSQAIDQEDYCLLLRVHRAVSSNGRAPIIVVIELFAAVEYKPQCAYQGKVSFHRTKEALSVLTRANDRRLSFIRPT